jgi:2-hydroxycyclohexanecarboxyl-CoA dehydrogenase
MTTGTRKTAATRLADASILITGGTSGLGLATARHFAAAGVPRIAINGRNAERGETALRALRDAFPALRCELVRGDVGVPAEAEDVARRTLAAFGAIDVLVTYAGGDHVPELFHEIAIDRVAPIAAHYLMAAMVACRAVLPAMMTAGRGAIINVASDAAKVPTPGETVIGAAMAGIAMFSRTLAMEAKRSGIRVNAVTPSLVANTPVHDRVMAAPFSAKLFRKAAAAAHLGLAEPHDIAALVVFLASPQAARLTGQVISLNGGISAG